MFAIGLGETTFPRLAADDWHRRAATGFSEGWPVPLVDERDAGHFDSIEVIPLADKVRVTTRAAYTPSTPDATLTTEYEVRPILTNGEVTAEVKLVNFDADTGLLGDLLGALGGALAGALLGGVGATFGAVGGVIIWETAEEVLESGSEDSAEEQGAAL